MQRYEAGGVGGDVLGQAEVSDGSSMSEHQSKVAGTDCGKGGA
jgi:hypothetical protein